MSSTIRTDPGYCFIGQEFDCLARQVPIAFPDRFDGLPEDCLANRAIDETRQVALLSAGPGQIAPNVSIRVVCDDEIPSGHRRPLTCICSYALLARASDDASDDRTTGVIARQSIRGGADPSTSVASRTFVGVRASIAAGTSVSSATPCSGLRRDIYDGTEPHVLVEIEELQEPEGRFLAVRVPSGLPPHTTTDGVARIRIGKDSKPLTGSTLGQLLVTRGGRDVTADRVPGVRFADLDQAQVRRLRQTIVTGAERRNLAGLGDRELLEALGLTFGPDVTLAAVLLLGNRPTLARYAPHTS